MINKNRLINLTKKLIRINSENPGGSERKIALFIKKYLKEAGISSRIYEFSFGRSNLISCLKGIESTRRLLITPHIDTVPRGSGWTYSPFEARQEKGRIYGLGATDCKGNTAVAIEVINSLKEDGVKLDYDLVFAATADEECGSKKGLIPLLEKKILSPSAAIVLDSDDFNIITTQKGLLHLRIKIEGKRSHGAYPWRGINAIERASDLIQVFKREKFPYKKNKLLFPPTINVGKINGGDKVNIVADWCEIELDFRFLPQTSSRGLLRKIEKVAKRIVKNFEIEIMDCQLPYSINTNHPLVRGLKRAFSELKIRPKIKGSEGATVITFFQKKDIPAVATGFGSKGCSHCIDEFAEINSLYKGALALERFLKSFKFI